MSSNSKIQDWRRQGYQAEFNLVVHLRMCGFKAIRIGAGGSSPNLYYTPLPDVIASKNGHFYSFEVKRRKNGYSYVQKGQIEKLFLFMEIVPIPEENKHAVVAVKTGRDWRFWEIAGETKEKAERDGVFHVKPDTRGVWDPKEV